MSLVINTNIASLTAQKNLSSNQTALNTSLERLSSGLRINSAKDDAAGLAISNRFTTQINGLNQAVQNSQDGISLSQTAEGALQEVTNNLQRIRTLAVQSANATNSASDRTAIDGEVQQRISEITRIASQTTFNSQNILNGTLGTVQFQVGADVGQTISVGLTTNVAAGAIGSYVAQSGAQNANTLTTTAGTSGTATQASTAAVPSGTLTTTTFAASPTTAYAGVSSAAFTNGSFTINGSGVLDSSGANFVGPSTGQSSDSAYAKAAAINGSGISGVSASATTSLVFGTSGGTSANGTDFLALSTAAAGTGSLTYGLTINGVSVFSSTLTAATTGTTSANTTAGVSLDTIITNVNQYSASTGVVASKTSGGNLQLAAADGRNIQLSESFSGLDGNTTGGAATAATSFSKLAETAQGTAASVTQAASYRGQITLTSSSNVQIGGTVAQAGFTAAGTFAAASNLASQNVKTVTASNDLIESVNSALTAIDALRANFGAVQNRFQSTIASLSTTTVNLTAARSRIQDADFASETANLTRAQILQQAGTSILAQSNSLPQGVLKLLQ